MILYAQSERLKGQAIDTGVKMTTTATMVCAEMCTENGRLRELLAKNSARDIKSSSDLFRCQQRVGVQHALLARAICTLRILILAPTDEVPPDSLAYLLKDLEDAFRYDKD